MLRDARTLLADTTINCDICIAGAGAAGITIARHFLGSKYRVCLLESGGGTRDAETQDLYSGEVSGLAPYSGEVSGLAPANYLTRSRLRYFGGTTNHWVGWCRPLEPMDFEHRPWVPLSGWPIDRKTLDPWYQKAAPVVQIPPIDDGPEVVRPADRRSIPFPTDSGLLNRVFHFSPPTRFANVYSQELIDADNMYILLNANLVKIESMESGEHVKSYEVVTLAGNRLRVASRLYVLATGGIENARILLHSNLGNDKERVGKCFMDHLVGGSPRLITFTKPNRSMDLYLGYRPDKAVVCLAPWLQRKYRLLNFSIWAGEKQPTPGVSKVSRAVVKCSHVVDNATSTMREGSLSKGFLAQVGINIELEPSSGNQVTLSVEKDRLGVPKTKLHWSPTDGDRRSLVLSLKVLAQQLGRFGQGRVQVAVEDSWSRFGPADHHMGTTRMGTNLQESVVDSQCRVHGINNLFVAGSSVFPTIGFANPTFTLIALSLRLSHYLQETLDGSPRA